MLIKYQEQQMLIRHDHWTSVDYFDQKDFKLEPCVTAKGRVVKPRLVMNNEAPMLHMNHFGILS